MIARLVLALAFALASAASLAQEIVAPAIRNVTPPGMTPGPAGNGPLVRDVLPPRPPEPPRWRRYFLPATPAAGTFVVRNGLVIHVTGVTPLAVGDSCTFADGAPWPCGRTARYQFRMFLRGRAVECLFPYADSLADITAPCRVGATDLGTWLLRSGWARPSERATEEYLSATAEARCSRRGIWQGDERPENCPPLPPTSVGRQVGSPDPWLPD